MIVDTSQPIDTGIADERAIAAFDTQRTGRMGELVVELELLKRGWIVGNFNSTTANSAGWDLFATRDNRSVKIRVKAKRPGVANFRWSAKADGTVFLGNSGGDDDYVAAVSFDTDGSHSVYIIRTIVVARTLEDEHRRWVTGERKGGGVRKDTPMRSIYIDDRVDGAAAHGFKTKWAAYEGAWASLDHPS